MLFSRKATRVLDEQTELFQEKEKAREDKYGQEEKEKLERKDLLAMWVAGFITFVPAILFVCALFGLVIWFFFLRFV